MQITHIISQISFYSIATAILIAAVLTVTVRNLFRAAIFLAFTLIGVAGIYFLMHAEFLGAIQILIYVGAIMTLMIFAVMLTSRLGNPVTPQTNRQRLPALFVLLGLAGVLILVILKTKWPVGETAQNTNAVVIGKALMGEFVLPFELISVVLLAALVGAIVISRSDE